MNFGYVCTNFNNTRFTQLAVKSLVDGGANSPIVVVDNKSDDENRQLLKDLGASYSNVDLVLNDENVGYFPGLNIGLRHFRERYPGIDYIVVGNNDLVFPLEFSSKLWKVLPSLQSHAVISPDIVTVDGVHQNPHVISAISKRREVIYDLYYSSYVLAKVINTIAKLTKMFTDRRDEERWQEPGPIYQGHGACYILTPVFFEYFTELWAPSFLMGEEFFLSKQLNDRGLQVYYEPAIQVVHHWHASVGTIPSRKIWEISRQAHNTYRKYVRIID
jgi:GT2 family glycosyltransferase